jgi:hypothetical protein
MKRWRRIVLAILAGVVLVGGTTWAVLAIRHRIQFGQVFDESDLHPAVAKGDRFSIAIPDRGGSVGDEWSATVTPADAVSAKGNVKVMSNLMDRVFGPLDGGGAGTRFFTYVADQPGTVTVKLFNCFQGLCKNRNPDPYSRGVTWTITVT